MPFLRSLLVLLACCAASLGWSAGLEGTYRMVKDSNGTAPRAGAVVELVFATGTFTFKAVQPGETVEDKGTYRVVGNTITITFEEMEQGRQSGALHAEGRRADAALHDVQRAARAPPPGRTWTRSPPPSAASGSTLGEVLKRTLEDAQKSAKERAKVDRLATLAVADVKGGLAEAYYVQASLFFFKSYYFEAWYGFAKAAQLQPTNGIYLNNLAMVLMELDKYGDALVILKEVTAWFPQLDPPWGNLATAYWKTKDLAKAEAAVQRAIALSPGTGLYQYLYGRILKEKGRKQEAQDSFDRAWTLGCAGSGREGEPGKGEAGAPGSSTGAPGASGTAASGAGKVDQGHPGQTGASGQGQALSGRMGGALRGQVRAGPFR